jgi:tRNA threonylcarbamoyladenosine biosynthesis protein TsaB
VNILAIDTSSEVLQLALAGDGFFLSNIRIMGFKHAEILVPMIDSLLHEGSLNPRELDLVVCAKGPGSFTGLRIGIATAKGIAEGAGCPLVTVPSLEAMAASLGFIKSPVVPVMDARKQRYYAQIFIEEKPSTEPLDIPPLELAATLLKYPGACITGPGSLDLEVLLRGHPVHPRLTFLDPRDGNSAGGLISLGRKILDTRGPDSPEEGPLYLRPSEAELSKN